MIWTSSLQRNNDFLLCFNVVFSAGLTLQERTREPIRSAGGTEVEAEEMLRSSG